MQKTKFDLRSVESFGFLFLIVCPHCQKCAQVLTHQEEECVQVRLICASCGLAKAWVQNHAGIYTGADPARYDEGAICIGAPVDWYFHEPLWLQEHCCGHILWAYNGEHLAWLRTFVSDRQRQRAPHPEHGWSNRSLISRLPKWVKSASNRKALLQAITRMERRLAVPC